MQPMLTRGKVYKLKNLLPMKYKVSEIAEFLGVTPETIYRSYLPAGAPMLREGDTIWIIGTEFHAWARAYLAGKRLARHRMTASEAWCVVCRRATEMINPRVMSVDERRVARVAARCKECGGRVSRFVRQGDDGKTDQS